MMIMKVDTADMMVGIYNPKISKGTSFVYLGYNLKCIVFFSPLKTNTS